MEYTLPFCVKSKNYFQRLKCELVPLKKLKNEITLQIKYTNKYEALHCRPPHICKINNNEEYDCTEEYYRNVQSLLTVMAQYIAIESSSIDQLPDFISFPGVSSLPSICSNLWKKIEAVCKTKNNCNKMVFDRTTRTIENNIKLSKHCQTEDSCISYCESCEFSTSIIKWLVFTILSEQKKCGFHANDSSVSVFREKLGGEIFNLSQWGAMTGWVTAIKEDIQKAAALIKNTQMRLLAEQQAQQKTRRNFETTVLRIKDDLALAKSHLEAEQAQNLYLKNRVDDLANDLDWCMKQSAELVNQTHEDKWKLKFQVELIVHLKNTLTQLKNKQTSLKRFIKSKLLLQSSETSANTNNIIDLLREVEKYATSIIRNETTKLINIEFRLSEKEDKIELLTTTNMKLVEDNKTLKDKVKFLESVINENENIIRTNNLQMKTEKDYMINNKIKNEQTMSEYDTGTESSGQVPISFLGDPLIDMEQQRQRNKDKIKALLKENAGIKDTLRKLRRVGSSQSSTSSSQLSY